MKLLRVLMKLKILQKNKKNNLHASFKILFLASL